MYILSVTKEYNGLLSSISPDTWVSAVGTLVGAFLGAFFAGKYALKSVQEQINFQKNTDKEDLEIQTIKFEDSYERIFNLLALYCEIYRDYMNPERQKINDSEKGSRINLEDIPDLFKNRLEEIRKYSLTLKMDRQYEIYLIEYLNQANIMYVSIVRWRPEVDEKDAKVFADWTEDMNQLHATKDKMSTYVETLKEKYAVRSERSLKQNQ